MTRKNKFGAKGCRIGDKYFASKGEASLYQLLTLRQEYGEIKDLVCHPTFSLTKADIKWKVDFSYFDLVSKEEVAAEYKGVETSDYRIKKKLWKFYGPIKLEIYKGSYKTWPQLVEIIKPI